MKIAYEKSFEPPLAQTKTDTACDLSFYIDALREKSGGDEFDNRQMFPALIVYDLEPKVWLIWFIGFAVMILRSRIEPICRFSYSWIARFCRNSAIEESMRPVEIIPIQIARKLFLKLGLI